ncbi:unnamed protein product [Acanthoscelides obtectus]|uniref:Secreted protein n=1 Tax=Acanthoscelides obtectus TaxID=200917 RepID=A0A9P0PYW6_ACAOB|nr:unnamed protein product [Acanthoscelides obtectus]CAK1625152.1 hypothetical protein AOBTE_LOCUS2993 [Acanthoscelides obtectus]
MFIFVALLYCNLLAEISRPRRFRDHPTPKGGCTPAPPRPPSLASVPENGVGWRHGNDHQHRASFWAEKGSISPLTNDAGDSNDKFNSCFGDRCKLSPVGDPSVPWWELATRKSRYRSCPALEMHTYSCDVFRQTAGLVKCREEREGGKIGKSNIDR